MSNTLENRVKAVVARYEEAAPFDGATFYIGDSGDVFKSRPFSAEGRHGGYYLWSFNGADMMGAFCNGLLESMPPKSRLVAAVGEGIARDGEVGQEIAADLGTGDSGDPRGALRRSA